MDDYIGGRYSSTSAVGGAILSLAYGYETFAELLAGAHEEDELALGTELAKNPALLDALIGVYERNVLGMAATAVLPYSEALSRFPAHLQQLDMESNGKSVNREGKPVAYKTGPLVFGEPGTNGQHSFYQLLHQGTDALPLQFIGFRKNQMSKDVVSEGSTSSTPTSRPRSSPSRAARRTRTRTRTSRASGPQPSSTARSSTPAR
jgi:glucose-6-phosphate isomerase